MEFSFKAIGKVHSCFREKFGIPRQPGLAPASHGKIELFRPYSRQTLLGLEGFSHVWVIFVFHQCLREDQPGEWNATVRPPRLGGNERVGVFASRSMFRPNPIGMSVVKLDSIEHTADTSMLHISDLDLLDSTPVLDIKPYLPYADSIMEVQAGYAPSAPDADMQVSFSDTARQQCIRLQQQHPDIEQLIIQILSLDPRPAYYSGDSEGRQFGMKIYDVDLKWIIEGGRVKVLSLD